MLGCLALPVNVDVCLCRFAQSLGIERVNTRHKLLALGDGVDLGAIASRQDYAFADYARLPERSQCVQRFARIERELLAHLDWSGGVAHAGDDQRHESSLSTNVPFSTESQKSLSSSFDDTSCQRSSPLASERARRPRSTDTACSYRLSKRSAIASRIRAAAPGTPPAETAIVTSPDRCNAIV